MKLRINLLTRRERDAQAPSLGSAAWSYIRAANMVVRLHIVLNLLKPTGYVMHQQFNLLKPTGYVMHQQFNLLKPTGYVMHQQFNLLKPTGYVMHQQFNIQQLYALFTLYLCVLYLSENKQRLVPLTA